jgi:Na+/H+ antiporter NhaC
MVADDVAMAHAKEGVALRAHNMIVPIAVMIGIVPIVLYISGQHALEAQGATGNILDAIAEGSGSVAVLWGVVGGLFTGAVSYKIQGILDFQETTEQLVKGIQGLVPLVIVLSLAFTIGATTRALGTGVFIAQAAEASIHTGLIPALVFLLACFIAFSTGTSWGTFGIMIPIVIPMIEILGLHGGLTIAAALGGGIFGDHCSPISDSTIVASMASATDHIDHVRTQLPYALTAATGATVLFLIFGFIL